MKKDYNSKKKEAIAALSLVAVCLVVGLFYFMGTKGNEPPLPTESKPPVETEVVVPEIKVESKPTEGSTPADNSDTSTDTNVDKPSDDKPKTPQEAAPPTEQPKAEDGKDRTPPPAQSGKDHEFTPEAPDKTPEYKPEQSKPNGNTSQPKDGDKKDGQIYIEGFGWIEDEGGGSDVKDTDNGNHNGNKVGDM